MIIRSLIHDIYDIKFAFIIYLIIIIYLKNYLYKKKLLYIVILYKNSQKLTYKVNF